MAPGVWFQQFNDIEKLGSNKSWIIFDDFVLVIDTGFPKGAEEALANIRQTTDKPIRFAVDTHYHADHSFGNGVFAKAGATIIGHDTARARLPGQEPRELQQDRREGSALRQVRRHRPATDVQQDDGHRRRQAARRTLLLRPGPHQGLHLDLPAQGEDPLHRRRLRERPLQLHGRRQPDDLAGMPPPGRQPGHETVCPGHGTFGKANEIIGNQTRYFTELRNQVTALVKAGKSLEETKKAVDIPFWKEWTKTNEYHAMFYQGIEVAYKEAGGKVPEKDEPKK